MSQDFWASLGLAVVEFAIVAVAIPVGLAIRDRTKWSPMRRQIFYAFEAYFEDVSAIQHLDDNFRYMLQDRVSERFALGKELDRRGGEIVSSTRAALTEKLIVFGPAMTSDLAAPLSVLVGHVERFERERFAS